MDALTPLDSLFELERGSALPLPPELATLYGPFQLSLHPDRPTILSNFVTTLDGVVALNESDHAGGGDISGFNQHDRMIMGLLRAIAGAVIVGAGTLRSVPRHLWTAEYIYPPLAGPYQQLRTSLGKPEPPLNVIVTARGEVDLQLPVFQSSEVPALLITTTHGAERLRAERVPPSVQVSALQNAGSLNAQAILQAVRDVRQSDVILVEGGPQLMGDFFAGQALDELFLTLSPQIAGRDGQVERPGLVMGKRFAPAHPLWGTLISVKRSGSHLFLRYAYP
ncbi:MAG TPA: dihydrofolate reductase family protein [Ktedonobacteraceae bacterium]